jgi:hypothetical protein
LTLLTSSTTSTTPHESVESIPDTCYLV